MKVTLVFFLVLFLVGCMEITKPEYEPSYLSMIFLDGNQLENFERERLHYIVEVQTVSEIIAIPENVNHDIRYILPDEVPGLAIIAVIPDIEGCSLCKNTYYTITLEGVE